MQCSACWQASYFSCNIFQALCFKLQWFISKECDTCVYFFTLKGQSWKFSLAHETREIPTQLAVACLEKLWTARLHFWILQNIMLQEDCSCQALNGEHFPLKNVRFHQYVHTKGEKCERYIAMFHSHTRAWDYSQCPFFLMCLYWAMLK